MQRDVTDLLLRWGQGDQGALDRLMPAVYRDLRALAGSIFARESPGHTLQPTAVVNEVYMRLVDQRRVRWRNRAQFFSIAARMMRRILVDHARKRRALKRITVIPEPGRAVAEQRGVDLIALDEALEKLAGFAPRQAQVVELRFFAGLTLDETAAALEVSRATVKVDWSMARSWLSTQMHLETGDDGAG
jgi:RNA polymerase sigma factor (TIGR02999 family)